MEVKAVIKDGSLDYGAGCLMALLSSPACDIQNWEVAAHKKTNRKMIWKNNGEMVELNANSFTRNTGFVQADLMNFRTPGKATFICQKCWSSSEKAKQLWTDMVQPFKAQVDTTIPRQSEVRCLLYLHMLKHLLIDIACCSKLHGLKWLNSMVMAPRARSLSQIQIPAS